MSVSSEHDFSIIVFWDLENETRDKEQKKRREKLHVEADSCMSILLDDNI